MDDRYSFDMDAYENFLAEHLGDQMLRQREREGFPAAVRGGATEGSSEAMAADLAGEPFTPSLEATLLMVALACNEAKVPLERAVKLMEQVASHQ